MEYLRALMTEADIRTFAELSRLSGVSETQFSNWGKAKSQPSRDSLKRLAPHLRVAPARLYLAAGINDAEDLDLTAGPDLTVLPAELRTLIEVWPQLSDDQQMFARRSLAVLVGGLRAELVKSEVKPSGRRRTA